MLLKDWIKKEGLTVAEFAKKVGVSKGSIYQNFSGDLNFSIELAEEISKFTRGEVQVDEIRKKKELNKCPTCGRINAKKPRNLQPHEPCK